ncbi:MAG: hypothetical protein H7A25_18340 [Leptospiraceae bacterium]|nr:hypothetical protein [Leptospiraceae bacterium]MCP5501867.1 hypothetical protein [Leptospiraceae bacterium]
MAEKHSARNAFDAFLEISDINDDDELIEVLLEYLEHLYLDETEEEPEEILLEDLTHFEVDDFINFYLIDNYTNHVFMRKKYLSFFKRFLGFASKKGLMEKDEINLWKEVLS